MGMILKDNEKGVHAEACRETFKLFTDFGHQSIELDWEKLEETYNLVRRLREHSPLPRVAKPRLKRCHYCKQPIPFGKARLHDARILGGTVLKRAWVGECCWDKRMT
jgi:hypothetical protein